MLSKEARIAIDAVYRRIRSNLPGEKKALEIKVLMSKLGKANWTVKREVDAHLKKSKVWREFLPTVAEYATSRQFEKDFKEVIS